MIGRLHKARTLALFRSQTHLRVRLQTYLGFFALYATWDLVPNTVSVKGRKKMITVDQLASRLAKLCRNDRKMEIRDGEAD